MKPGDLVRVNERHDSAKLLAWATIHYDDARRVGWFFPARCYLLLAVFDHPNHVWALLLGSEPPFCGWALLDNFDPCSGDLDGG